MIFDHYDRIRIVNLPERQDRREETDQELQRIGWRSHPKIDYFPALRMSDPGPFLRVGSHGNFLGQLQILEDALAAQQTVLIMEDDCRFLPAISTFTPASDTDILYGGFEWASMPENLPDADIIGSHCMGFSLPAIERLVPFLKSLLDLSTQIDPAIVRSEFNPQIRPPIDGAYVWFRRYNPDLKTEFASVACQRSSATDVGDRRWFDNYPVTRSIARYLRRLRG